MRALKPPSRLRREIAQYIGVIHRTTSRDVIRRAHIAIRARERDLAEALRARGRTR